MLHNKSILYETFIFSSGFNLIKNEKKQKFNDSQYVSNLIEF